MYPLEYKIWEMYSMQYKNCVFLYCIEYIAQTTRLIAEQLTTTFYQHRLRGTVRQLRGGYYMVIRTPKELFTEMASTKGKPEDHALLGYTKTASELSDEQVD